MEFLTNIEQDGKKYSVRDLAAHVMIDSTRLDLKNFKRNSNIKLDSLEKLFNSFKSYAVCTKTDEGVPDVDEPSKSVIYLVKITAEGEEDPKYEMWIYDVTDTWQNLGISTTNLEGFIKTDDLGSELYYSSDDKKVHINVDNSTIKLNTAGKLAAGIEANPTDAATKKISSIKIGNTVYDNLPEAGTAISYSTNQVTPHDFETKVEQFIGADNLKEDVQYNNGYTLPVKNLYSSEYIKFNVIIPKEAGNYSSIILKLSDSRGKNLITNLSEVELYGSMFFEGTDLDDPDRFNDPYLVLNDKNDNVYEFVFTWANKYENYYLKLEHITCNYETYTDGKKINISIDDDSIKVSDDNKLYANLEPIETAIGKDEDDNLIKVADNIKDNAVNATYGTHYDYGTTVIEQQTSDQTIISWPETYEEIGLWLDIDNSGNYVYFGAFTKEGNNVIFRSTEIDGNKTYTGYPGTDNVAIILEFSGHGAYYFYYDRTPETLHTSFTYDHLPLKLTQQNFVTTTIKGKIDSVEDSIVNVEANPTEETTVSLSAIKVDDVVYSIEGTKDYNNLENKPLYLDSEEINNETFTFMINGTVATKDLSYQLQSQLNNQEIYNAIVNKTATNIEITINNKIYSFENNVQEDEDLFIVTAESEYSTPDNELINHISLWKNGDFYAVDIKIYEFDAPAESSISGTLKNYKQVPKVDTKYESLFENTIVEANPTEEATEDLTKIKVGDTVYSVGSSEGPSKIYDSTTDTTYHGNLWETDDGSITVGSSEDGYNELEIYYSSKDSGQIQYYKINTEMITSPKTDKGMFYVLVPGSNGSAFDFEQIEVSIVTDTEGKKSVKLASKAGTDSIVKIERVYNVQPGNGGSGGGGGTGSGVAPAEAPTEEGAYLVEAKLVAGEMTLTYKPVTDLDGETY